MTDLVQSELNGRGSAFRAEEIWSPTWEERLSPPPTPGARLLQDPAGPVEVPRGGRGQASQLLDGLAHWAGVLGQTLDVLKGHVDDLVAAGAAVEVSAREALEPHLVGDAALTVRQVGPQRQGARQGAALQAASLAGAELSRRPEERRD